jgi:hypothetical protein
MLYLKMGVGELDLRSSLFPLYLAFNFLDILCTVQRVKPLGMIGISFYVP